MEPNRPDLNLACGALALEMGDVGQAVRWFEAACRAAGRVGTHLLLGQSLMRLAKSSDPRRPIERASYHFVRAMQLDPRRTSTPGCYATWASVAC